MPLTGFAAFLATAIGLAPVASAAYLPPNPAGRSTGPPLPSAATTVAQLPVALILTMAAGTVFLSVATTLITLALTRLRDHRLLTAQEAQAGEAEPRSLA